MATPTLPRRSQILAILKSNIGAIRSGVASSYVPNPPASAYVYWYTPDRVLRVAGTAWDCLDKSYDTIYCISPDVTDKDRVQTGSGHNARVGLDLDLFKQYQPESATEDPFKNQDELREDYQDRMAADVEAKLNEDATYGTYVDANGLSLEVWNIEVIRQDFTPEATNVAGWARALLRVIVSYRYRSGAP